MNRSFFLLIFFNRRQLLGRWDRPFCFSPPLDLAQLYEHTFHAVGLKYMLRHPIRIASPRGKSNEKTQYQFEGNYHSVTTYNLILFLIWVANNVILTLNFRSSKWRTLFVLAHPLFTDTLLFTNPFSILPICPEPDQFVDPGLPFRQQIHVIDT